MAGLWIISAAVQYSSGKSAERMMEELL